MTERKKPGVTFESFVDKQIREAQEQGAFENLAGAGRPIPRGTGESDDLWWIKGYLQRENLSTDALLPESLQLRKEIERLPNTLLEIRYEESVRETLRDLNARVVAWIRMPSPPLVPLSPVDVEDWTVRWRRNRAVVDTAARESSVVNRNSTSSGPVSARWWQRLLRRPRR